MIAPPCRCWPPMQFIVMRNICMAQVEFLELVGEFACGDFVGKVHGAG
jgi:hypothetical protein